MRRPTFFPGAHFLSAMKTPASVLFLLLFLLPSTGHCGGKPPVLPIKLGPAREGAGDSFARRHGLKPEDVGFVLYDMEKSEVLAGHNRNRGFMPASTAKVPTVMAALDLLGPEYRYETLLLRDGSIRGDTLRGDLYLKGTGDPRLTLADLAGMVESLRESGVRRVEGKFYFDDSELARLPEIDAGMDDDAAYNPGLGALSIESNTVMINWSRRKKGGFDLLLTPDLPVNGAGTAEAPLPADVKFAFRAEDERDVWLLSPAVRARHGGKRLPVKKPGHYTAQIFARLCRMRGIRVGQPSFRETPSGASEIVAHKGRRLHELAETILTYSDNMMTELVLLRAARELTGRKLDLIEAGQALKEYWSRHLPGVDWSAFDMKNGSGLSSGSRITPDQLLAVLLYAEQRRAGGERFSHMLPIAGWKGSLTGRLVYADTALRVWAKTGTINYAVSLAGYLYSARGRKLAFVVFVNDPEQRRAYERNPDRRRRTVQKQANKWISASKYSIDQMLADWIRRY